MKDYYSRLDLPVTATHREIEAELPALDHAVTRRNARFVMLDPDRRAIYDQCHRALRQIAFLRANLGLNRSPFWLVSDVDDFTSEPFDRRHTKPRATWIRPAVITLALALVAWGSMKLFAPSSPTAEAPEKSLELSPQESTSEDFKVPETTEPSRRSIAEWHRWQETFRPEIAPVHKAWRSLTSGLDQRSFELAESRCRQLEQAVQRCDRNSLLPSPDHEVDLSLQRFLDHLAGAARACRRQRYFEMTEELDGAQESWDGFERRLRYHALEP